MTRCACCGRPGALILTRLGRMCAACWTTKERIGRLVPVRKPKEKR